MSREVHAAADALIAADILSWDRVATLRSLPVSPEFNAVALDLSSSYEQVYLKGLSLRHYNFLLNDQSFIQLSTSAQGMRFAYYPNPFTDPDGLLERLDDPLDFDAISISSLGATAGRAPLRYDYAEGQYVELLHPCAHFHLGHGELGRLAAKRIFCSVSFCLLVLRLYYPVEWGEFSVDPATEAGYSNSIDENLHNILVRNGLVNAALFSSVESRFVHIA